MVGALSKRIIRNGEGRASLVRLSESNDYVGVENFYYDMRYDSIVVVV
jgi:hypothetical protein